MRALKKVVGVMTFAALSFSGSAVWAESFKAKAALDGFNLVPPILSDRSGTITLTFNKPPPTPTTFGTNFAPALALRPKPTNPGTIGTTKPGNTQGDVTVENVRLYFGQRFAHGHPIATLCDNDIDLDKDNIDDLPCPDTGTTGTVKFALSDFQFVPVQLQRFIDETDSQVDVNRRIPDNEEGFRLIKKLIKRRLIYVVVNSEFKARIGAEQDEDEDGNPITITTIVRYKPPKCSILPSFYCKKPNGGIITDGIMRGTLRLVSPKK